MRKKVRKMSGEIFWRKSTKNLSMIQLLEIMSNRQLLDMMSIRQLLDYTFVNTKFLNFSTKFDFRTKNCGGSEIFYFLTRNFCFLYCFVYCFFNIFYEKFSIFKLLKS